MSSKSHPEIAGLKEYQQSLSPWRRFKPYKPDQIRVENNDWYRAGTNMICERCGCEYIDHEPVIGYEFLHKLCNGDLVKL
jgi:hypothetical protein